MRKSKSKKLNGREAGIYHSISIKNTNRPKIQIEFDVPRRYKVDRMCGPCPALISAKGLLNKFTQSNFLA